MADALKLANGLSFSLGFVAIVVDAKDEKAANFYLELGFTRFEGHPTKLAISLKTIEDSFK